MEENFDQRLRRRLRRAEERVQELEGDLAEARLEVATADEAHAEQIRELQGLIRVYADALKAACEAAEGDEQLTGADAKEKGMVLLSAAAEKHGVKLPA